MDQASLEKTYYGFILVKKNNGTICGRFPLTKKECSIGRDKSCDLRILLDHVSAQHCIISCINDNAYVRDKSLAGTTKVNGKKIGRSNFLLHQSDEIEICGRKFVWEYPWTRDNYLSGKKSGTNLNCMTPRVSTRVSSQVNTPLVPQDNNKILQTPAKSSMKTLISINKTPIVLAAKNMSKLSFEELKESFKDQNIDVHSQSEPRVTKSYSMVSGRNIPLIGNSKITQRKSWVITSTEDISSGAYNLNRLSSERSKIDCTPEYDTSYHYEDDNVEFDTTEPPFILSNDEHSINMNTTGVEANNLSLHSPSDSIKTQIDSHSQSGNIPDFESEQSSSRRDTYSIGDRPVLIEQSTTPAPRRSILKCSKTARPNRSRSSCRMVQFARLPKSDSRIKMSRSRFNTGSNFVITNDEVNDIDVTQDSRKVDVEAVEFDDDLDGVQPLDSSVSSLINSPILENSVLNKSSKRGSRGNKVMSLINSFEKRTTENPKHSIRASDLLITSELKHGDTSLNNDSQNDTNTLQESVSSARRVNLENIFEAEDSLKNLENETIVPKKIVENSVQNMDISTSSAKQSLLNIDNEKISDDLQNKDLSECVLECEYNFASPLNLHPQIISSGITDTENISDIQNKDVSGNIESEYNFASPLNLRSEMNAVSVTEKDNVHNEVKNSPIHELNNLSNLDNINTHDEEDNDKTQNIVEKSSDVLELSNGSIIEKNNIEVQNNVSKLIEQISDEESPSMIVQCMSEMFNNTVDKLEITNSNHKLDISQSFVMVEKEDFQNSKKSIEFNTNSNQKINDEKFNRFKEIVQRKSALAILADNDNSIIMDNIEAKLSEVHGYQNTNSNETVLDDTMSSVNKEKVMTSDFNSQDTVIDSVKDTDSPFTKPSVKESSTLITDGKSIHDIVDETTSNIKEESGVENNSKHTIERNLSKQSIIEHDETHNSIRTVEFVYISSESDSDEIENNKNMDKTQNNQSLSTSIGKPQYESTPWNGSRNSKVTLDSTSSLKPNETTCGGVSENEQLRENSPQTILFPEDPEVWAQMMKDFNESVKKASFTQTNAIDVSTINKVLFDQESKSTEKGLSSNFTNIANNDSKIEKNNTLQCSTISSCLPDNNTSKIVNNDSTRKSFKSNNKTTPQRSSSVNAVNSTHVKNNDNFSKSSIHEGSPNKNNSISIEKTNKTDKQSETMQTKCINKSSDISKRNITLTSADTDSDIHPDSSLSKSPCESNETKRKTRNMKKSPSPSLPSAKRKLRARVNKNELDKSIEKIQSNNKRIKIIVSDETSTNNCDTDNMSSSGSENVSSTPVKQLRLRNLKPTVKSTTSIEQKNSKIVEKSSVKIKPVTLPIKTRRTRNNTLTESNNVLKLNKKNKTLSPIKTKTKVEKIIETKKSNQSRSKRTKLSKTSTSDSLEDESSIETKKTPQKPQVSNLPKVSKENIIETKNSNQSRPRRTKLSKTSTSDSLEDESSIETKKIPQKPQVSNLPKASKENIKETKNSNQSRPRRTKLSKTSASDSLEDESSIETKKTPQKLQVSNLPKASKENIKETKNSNQSRPRRTKLSKTSASDTLEDESSIETKKTPQKPQVSNLPKASKENKETKNSNQSRPKRIQFSKTSASDSSEDEPLSKTKKIFQKPQISNPSKVNKFKKKDDIQIDNILSIPTKRNLKEKTGEISLNISPQIRTTRGRKRAADNSADISAPNAKGLKHDILSKVASTTVTRGSNSPQSVKRTRNMVKSRDNSFPESTVDSKKEKFTRTTRANKRDLNSEDTSNDSASSARKKSKKANSSSIKTRKVNFEEPSTSANKRLNKNTKQPVPEVKQSPAPTPRVLRLRQKKQ